MTSPEENASHSWVAGDLGPSGETRDDGRWPCQCMTCSACPEPTKLTVRAADGDPSARTLLCVLCTRRGHLRLDWTDLTDRPRWTPRQAYTVPTVGSDADREWEAARDREAAEDSRRRKAEEDLRYWDAKSPGRFKASEVDTHTAPAALEDINSFVENVTAHRKRGINLILLGTLGGGKTYLMHSIARRLVAASSVAPQLIRFGTETQLLHPVVYGYPSDQMSYVNDLTDPSKTSLILIDEAGRGNFTKDEDRYAAWDTITSFAYNHDVPMIVTSNLMPRPTSTGSPEIGMDRAAANLNAFNPQQAASNFSDRVQSEKNGEAVGSTLNRYMSDAAYDRLINSTPRERVTTVLSENRRGDVNRGILPRNHGTSDGVPELERTPESPW